MVNHTLSFKPCLIGIFHSISLFVSHQISSHTADTTTSSADVTSPLSHHTHVFRKWTHSHIAESLPVAKSEKPINGQIYSAVLRLSKSEQTADSGIAVTVQQNGASNVSVFQGARRLFG